MNLRKKSRSASVRSLWQHRGEKFCELVSCRKADARNFEDVLSVRVQTDPRWPDQNTSVDTYSDHYCMYVDGEPVGSLGVTRALEGDIFLAEYCPPVLLEEFNDSLVSAYRFRILSHYRRSSPLVPGMTLSAYMVREAWRDQIAKGAGLDLINIESTYVPLYSRFGYVLCEGYDYIDPVLGTPSSLMFLPVDPDRPSFIHDIIREGDLHVSLDSVMRALTRTQVYVRAAS